MKRIITSIAFVAITLPLSAMSPTDLIEQVRHHFDEMNNGNNTRTHYRSKHTRKKKVEVKYNKHNSGLQPNKRKFHSLSEYRRIHKFHHHIADHARTSHQKYKHLMKNRNNSNRSRKLGHYVGNGWFVDDRGQYDEQYQTNTSTDPYLWVPTHIRRQHGYRHYRRQWYLTYLYEHSQFDDRYGYHYGYFDHRGFVFDGKFYLYDRSYNYQDRLHGKGLFEHLFYRPIQRYDRHLDRADWEDEMDNARVDFYWSF